MQRLKHNKIQCKFCGDILESKYRHDFVECSCGSCFTDGGHDYMRCAGDFIDLSEWEEVPEDYIEDEKSRKLIEEEKCQLAKIMKRLHFKAEYSL